MEKTDKDGNVIYRKIEMWYEYDDRGNCVYQKNSNGFEAWWEFDKQDYSEMGNARRGSSVVCSRRYSRKCRCCKMSVDILLIALVIVAGIVMFIDISSRGG